MKIGKGSKKIIMHGGTHAREWITPITMINTVKKLVDENRAGGANAKYLDDITWYIAIRKGQFLSKKILKTQFFKLSHRCCRRSHDLYINISESLRFETALT